jgi:hypothetical protein
MLFKFNNVATAAYVGLGILDDYSGEGDAPANLSGVVNMRCSATSMPGTIDPTYIYYTPLDKSKWYYCNSTSSTSDPRFNIPASLYGATNTSAATQVFVELDYTLVFAGAEGQGTS